LKLNNLMNTEYRLIHQMNQAQKAISNITKQLSTGKQISSASDGPSYMRRISQLEAQIRGSSVAQKNIQDGLAFLDTKDHGLTFAQQIGHQIRELAVQYQNGTLSQSDRKSIQNHAKKLFEEFQHIFENTKFNGRNVFENKDLVIQAGPNPSDAIILPANPESSPISEGTSASSSGNQHTGTQNQSPSIEVPNEIKSYTQPEENPENLQPQPSMNSNPSNEQNIENMQGETVDIQGERVGTPESPKDMNVPASANPQKETEEDGIEEPKELFLMTSASILYPTKTVQETTANTGDDKRRTLGLLDRLTDDNHLLSFGLLDEFGDKIDEFGDKIKDLINGIFGKGDKGGTNQGGTGNPDIPNQPIQPPTGNDGTGTGTTPSTPSTGTTEGQTDPVNPTPSHPSTENPSVPSNPNPETPGNVQGPEGPSKEKGNEGIGNHEVPQDKGKVENNDVPQTTGDEKGKTGEGNSLMDILLNPDFIDRFILEPIASKRTTVGIQRNLLEHRLSFEIGQNDIRISSYTQIQDVDVAKSIMGMVKNQLLTSTNSALLQQSLDDRRDLVYQLLYSL